MSAQYQNPWAQDLPKPVDEMPTYLCTLPDFTEGSKRMSVRPIHLEHAAVGHSKGWIIKAGAMFADDAQSKMIGSFFLMREVSAEACRARLAGDVYALGGAWDMSKAHIQRVAVAKH